MKGSALQRVALAIGASAFTLLLGVWIWRQFLAATMNITSWLMLKFGPDHIEGFLTIAMPVSLICLAVSSLLMLPAVFGNKSR